MEKSRRNVLAFMGLAPVALLVGRNAQAQGAACYDPAKLSLSDRNNRSAVNFQEVSKDATKRCGLCVFFDPGQGACGSCKLFSGMPVTARSVCDSFSAKPA